MKILKSTEIANLYARKLRPLSCMIELTNDCNFQCIHCYINKSEIYYLDTERIFQLLDEAKELGVFKIAYTGGEPLIHPDFMKIIEYTEKLGFKYSVLTNGYLLDDKMIKKFERSKFLNNIHLSFYGVTAETHDSITAKKGSFAKLITDIKKLKKANIKFLLKTAIMKKNYNEWQNIMDFCDKNQYLQVTEFTLFPEETGRMFPVECMLNRKELLEINYILRDKYKKKMALKGFIDDKQKFLESIVCVAGHNKFMISYNGNFYPCISLRIKVGNIFDDNLKNIWYNNNWLNEFRKIRNCDIVGCNSCDIFEYCRYKCPGISQMFYGDMYRAPKVRCMLAEINKEVIENNEKKIL